MLTRKNSHVDPWYSVPYWTSFCVARSSGELIGVTIRSTVRKAAKLAVYEEMRMSVKNHHTEPTIRPEMERGDMSQPCCMNAPRANQNELKILNSFTVACWPPEPPLPPPPPFEPDCVACPTSCCASLPSAIGDHYSGYNWIGELAKTQLPEPPRMRHSCGEKRETMKSTILTPT